MAAAAAPSHCSGGRRFYNDNIFYLLVYFDWSVCILPSSDVFCHDVFPVTLSQPHHISSRAIEIGDDVSLVYYGDLNILARRKKKKKREKFVTEALEPL